MEPAFYVRGTMEGNRPYSIQAKRHFYIGLDVIANCLGFKNLVAVYIDINWCSNLERPAYAQMKQDIQNSQFQRIFVTCFNDLFEDWVLVVLVVDIQQLATAKDGLEILALETTACSFKENLLQDGLKVSQIEMGSEEDRFT